MTDTFASYGYSINYLVRNLEGCQNTYDLFLGAFSTLSSVEQFIDLAKDLKEHYDCLPNRSIKIILSNINSYNYKRFTRNLESIDSYYNRVYFCDDYDLNINITSNGCISMKVVEGNNSIDEFDKICNHCLNSNNMEGMQQKKCSGCKLVYYCSEECQKADWKKHKHICKQFPL